MDERLERLTMLFDTLKTCTQQIDQSGLRLDEQGYLFAVHEIGSFLVNVGTQGFANRDALLEHWINEGPTKCERLLSSVNQEGRGAITERDIRTLLSSPKRPIRPEPRFSRR
jgi:hypothetical protein